MDNMYLAIIPLIIVLLVVFNNRSTKENYINVKPPSSAYNHNNYLNQLKGSGYNILADFPWTHHRFWPYNQQVQSYIHTKPKNWVPYEQYKPPCQHLVKTTGYGYPKAGVIGGASLYAGVDGVNIPTSSGELDYRYIV